MWFLSTDRFHGIFDDLCPSGKEGQAQHPIWGSSAPFGRRSPFLSGWYCPPGIHPYGPKNRITEIGRLHTKDESAITRWPHLANSGRRCRKKLLQRPRCRTRIERSRSAASWEALGKETKRRAWETETTQHLESDRKTTG